MYLSLTQPATKILEQALYGRNQSLQGQVLKDNHPLAQLSRDKADKKQEDGYI